jgi:hypothetical protein
LTGTVSANLYRHQIITERHKKSEKKYVPGKTGEFADSRSGTSDCHSRYRLSKLMRRPNDQASNAEQHCAKKGNISLPKQILHIPHEWSNDGNAQRIRSG